MKRLGILLALLALVSCSPQMFLMDVEMRHPSRSGLDLARKSMAVVYLDNGTPADSAFNGAMASAFARALEKDYFGGDEVIQIYRMPKGEGNYASLDTLHNLIMDTGDDVVFLFDSTEFGELGEGSNTPTGEKGVGKDSAYVNLPTLPFKIRLYAYDSMNKVDSVYSYTGANMIRPAVYNDGTISYEQLSRKVWDYVAPSAETIGSQASAKFLSQWQQEQFAIVYYENSEWEQAATDAYNYEWKQALDRWLKIYTDLVNRRGNPEMRACAAYDIGLACFMLGQNELALRWLDRSDADQILSVTEPLRKQIKSFGR